MDEKRAVIDTGKQKSSIDMLMETAKILYMRLNEETENMAEIYTSFMRTNKDKAQKESSEKQVQDKIADVYDVLIECTKIINEREYIFLDLKEKIA